MRALGPIALTAALSALTLVVSLRANAAEPLGAEAPGPTPPPIAGTEQAVVARYWELGRTRPFLTARLEAGFAYLRPRFGAGYGRPFWSWIGVEAYPLLSTAGLGHYFGAAASIPGLTFRVGGRYYRPFGGSFLPPKDHFTRSDIELVTGPTADYVAYDGELTGTVPLHYGSVFAVLSGVRTALVPEDVYLFEESLRVVMKPPYAWRARLGYLLALGYDGSIRVGGTAEVIGLPGRGEHVIRGGFLGSVLINAHVEAQASLVPVIRSPDSLGIMGGDFGQLGIRLRWATDSKPDPARVRAKARQKLKETPLPSIYDPLR